MKGKLISPLNTQSLVTRVTMHHHAWPLVPQIEWSHVAAHTNSEICMYHLLIAAGLAMPHHKLLGHHKHDCTWIQKRHVDLVALCTSTDMPPVIKLLTRNRTRYRFPSSTTTLIPPFDPPRVDPVALCILVPHGPNIHSPRLNVTHPVIPRPEIWPGLILKK